MIDEDEAEDDAAEGKRRGGGGGLSVHELSAELAEGSGGEASRQSSRYIGGTRRSVARAEALIAARRAAVKAAGAVQFTHDTFSLNFKASPRETNTRCFSLVV